MKLLAGYFLACLWDWHARFIYLEKAYSGDAASEFTCI